ncbi:MAG TPA: hypothetical protein VNU68_32425, partial [Verrucomicrobiae bacterium]|nr:hypothetical protein [Verrucomicrobiae bacterium]
KRFTDTAGQLVPGRWNLRAASDNVASNVPANSDCDRLLIPRTGCYQRLSDPRDPPACSIV